MSVPFLTGLLLNKKRINVEDAEFISLVKKADAGDFLSFCKLHSLDIKDPDVLEVLETYRNEGGQREQLAQFVEYKRIPVENRKDDKDAAFLNHLSKYTLDEFIFFLEHYDIAHKLYLKWKEDGSDWKINIDPMDMSTAG